MTKLSNGSNLGPFRILHQIGEGGMARVYKAYQPSVERYVALKVLPSHYADDPQFIERFIREARTIARLEHKNILPVFDFGEQDGITYLAMRFVEGGTLKELMTKGCLTLHDTQDLMTQVCSALDYAHRHGVIHRDVKPSNVIIDGEGAAYLTDFGIAKVLGGSGGDLTATGAAIGTPAYMAPEQAVGGAVDARTDIYALGIMLYEMLTGRVPFQADTPMAVLMAHMSDPLPLPHVFNADIPEAIEEVVIKALAKNPEDRYQTANEMAQALRLAIHNTRPDELDSTLVKLVDQVRDSRQPPVQVTVQELPPDPRLKERLEQNYIDGLAAYWVRDWEKASGYFQTVVTADPAYKDAAKRLNEVQKQRQMGELYQRGLAASQNNDWAAARDAFQQVASTDASYQDASKRLAEASQKLELAELYAQAGQLFQAKQYEAVLKIFEQIQHLDSTYPDPDNLNSKTREALIEQKRQEKIKATYQHGLEALDAGRWKEAQKLFESVKSQQPGYGEVEQLLQRAVSEQTVARRKPAPAPAPEKQKEEKTLVSKKEAPSRRWIGWVLGLVVIAAMAALLFMLNSPDLRLALGIAKPTATFTQPAPTEVKVSLPTSNIVLKPYIYDSFENMDNSGKISLARWLVEDGCAQFAPEGQLIDNKMLVLNANAAPESKICQLWAQKGERFPAQEIGAFEANLQLAGEPSSQTASARLVFISDMGQQAPITARCGLEDLNNGKSVIAFNVDGVGQDQVYQRVAPAEHGRWYTIRLQIEPYLMSVRCLVDDETLGVFTPTNPEALNQVPFGRMLQVQTSPGVQERILVDDISIYPLEKAPPSGKSMICLAPPEGLVAWWPADGNNKNAAGGQPFELFNQAAFAPGWVNEAIRFDSFGWEKNKAGTAGISLANVPFSPASFSLETWVFLNAEPFTQGQAAIDSFSQVLNRPERFIDITPDEVAVLRKEGSGELHFYMNFDGELHHIWSPQPMPRGVWLHVAGTYDGTRMNLYLNGVNVGNLAVKGQQPRPESLNFSSGAEPLHGFLDEPTIYNRALGPDEIRVIFQAGRDGKCKP